jgi:hypothetical protein
MHNRYIFFCARFADVWNNAFGSDFYNFFVADNNPPQFPQKINYSSLGFYSHCDVFYFVVYNIMYIRFFLHHTLFSCNNIKRNGVCKQKSGFLRFSNQHNAFTVNINVLALFSTIRFYCNNRTTKQYFEKCNNYNKYSAVYIFAFLRVAHNGVV